MKNSFRYHIIFAMVVISLNSHARHQPILEGLDFIGKPELIFKSSIPPCPVYGVDGEMIDTKKCRPAGFSCNFYDKCISKLIDCEGQEKNYFTNYGLKYCNIFKRKLYMNTGVTDTTRLWIRCTMKCLQSSILKNYRETDYINSLMEETQQAKCSRYYKDAFDSHPDCYTNSGLCFLMPPTQQTRIALAVDTDDLFSEESKAQIKEVFANCANDLLDYADGEETLPPNILKVLDLQGHEAAYEYCELENLNSEEKDPCFKLRNKVTNYLDVCI